MSDPRPVPTYCLLFTKERHAALHSGGAISKEARKSAVRAIRDADLVGVLDGKFVKVIKDREGSTGTVSIQDWATLMDHVESYRG